MEDIVSVNFIENLIVRQRWTHKQVSEELKRTYPYVRGLSEMSVKRFCSKYNIHRTSRLSDGELDLVVQDAVNKVRRCLNLECSLAFSRTQLTLLFCRLDLHMGERC